MDYYPGEPEWLLMYEDTPGALWLSKDPIEVERSEDQTVKFWLYLEITDMEDACGEKAVHAEIGVVPHWTSMRVSQQLDVAKSMDPEWVGKLAQEAETNPEQYRGLAEATKSYGIHAPLEQAQVEWTEEDEDDLDDEGSSLFDRDLYWAKAKSRVRKGTDFEDIAGTMSSPVNRLGQDAWSFMFQDTREYLAGLSNPNQEQQIVAKMYQACTPAPAPERKIQFGTLHPDGTLTNRREIGFEDIGKCRFRIMVPEHYREDGSCRCDDAEHRQVMIQDWEYKEQDFEGIPLRSSDEQS